MGPISLFAIDGLMSLNFKYQTEGGDNFPDDNSDIADTKQKVCQKIYFTGKLRFGKLQNLLSDWYIDEMVNHATPSSSPPSPTSFCSAASSSQETGSRHTGYDCTTWAWWSTCMMGWCRTSCTTRTCASWGEQIFDNTPLGTLSAVSKAKVLLAVGTVQGAQGEHHRKELRDDEGGRTPVTKPAELIFSIRLRLNFSSVLVTMSRHWTLIQ